MDLGIPLEPYTLFQDAFSGALVGDGTEDHKHGFICQAPKGDESEHSQLFLKKNQQNPVLMKIILFFFFSVKSCG